MNGPNLHAYINLSSQLPLFDHLDTCVQSDLKRPIFVTGLSGSGRTALLEAWAKREGQYGRTVLIELVPKPASAIPMLAVVCSLLWYELLQIYHVTEGMVGPSNPQKPTTDDPSSWFTERQALNLFHHRILPMLDYVQTTAIVIDNASLLDHAAFPWVLKLQMPSDPRQRMIPRRTLIFGARLNPTPSSEHQFVKMVLDRPYLRLPWHERIKLELLDLEAFFDMWAHALEVNLRADFVDEISGTEQDELAYNYWQKTNGSWWGISDLLDVYHQELGPWRGQPYRIITRDVMQRVHERLKQVDWTVPETDETEKKKRGRGKGKTSG